MSDTVTPSGMGLTHRQSEALLAITAHVGRHGVMPSRRVLAAEMGCSPNNAVRLIHGLVERGELNTLTTGGPVTGFGSGGVFVSVPPDVAALLAQFCSLHGERVAAVVADAIALHLDHLSGVVKQHNSRNRRPRGTAPTLDAIVMQLIAELGPRPELQEVPF